MTVETTTSKAGPYAGAGTVGPFPVPFRFLDASHLKVTRTDPNGVDADLVLGVNYSVQGAGQTTGAVTLTQALPVGFLLTVLRNVPATQEADYVPNDAFPAESHERALDKLTMLAQQYGERAGRALVVPASDPVVSLELPKAAARARRYLSFDNSGRPVATTFDVDAVAQASQAAQAAAAAAKDSELQASISEAAAAASADYAREQSEFVAQQVAAATPTVVRFSGDGVQVQFELPSVPGAEENTQVYISGVYQQKNSYEVLAGTGALVFSEAPPVGVENVEVVIAPSVMLATGSAQDIYFTHGAGEASTRSVAAKLKEVVSVKDFGGFGDGVSDDSRAITAADAYAASIGASLLFPPGVYRAYGLSASCNWHASGQVTIKNNVRPGANIYGFMNVTGKTGLRFSGITFDGWATDDPAGGWNAGNYNSFQGSIACIVANCIDVHFENCKFQNSVNGPLRIDGSSKCTFTRCSVIRGRGNFGDGVYTRASSDIEFNNCTAYDFTRIGFVTEAGSKRIKYVNCRAEYGHDRSTLYGGGEFNAGFWCENSSDVIISSSTAKDAGTYGFVCTTGVATSPTGSVAGYTLTGCTSFNSDSGFLLQSFVGVPVATTLQGCKAYGSRISYYVSGANSTDSMTLIGCHSEISMVVTGGISQVASFALLNTTAGAGYPLITVDSCTIAHTAFDQASVESNSVNIADVSGLTGAGRCRVVLRNIHNVDSLKPVSIKQRIAVSSAVRYDISDMYVLPAGQISCEMFSANNCRFQSTAATISHSVGFKLENCSVGSGAASGAVNAYQKFYNVTFEPGVGSFNVFNATASKEPLVLFTGCTFKKDVAANDYAIRLQFEGAVNKPSVTFQSCTFYNTGATTATKVFIWVVRAGTGDNYAGCFSDSSVTNLRKVENALNNPASGNSPITMH